MAVAEASDRSSDSQRACSRQAEPTNPLVRETDVCGTCAGMNDELVLELSDRAGVLEINAWPDVPVDDVLGGGTPRMPTRTCPFEVAHVPSGAAGRDGGRLATADKVEAQRPSGGAGGRAGVLAAAVRVVQHHR